MDPKEVITHEVMGDVYTQAEYAKLIGVSNQLIAHRVKNRLVNTIEINGTTLIRLRN